MIDVVTHRCIVDQTVADLVLFDEGIDLRLVELEVECTQACAEL